MTAVFGVFLLTLLSITALGIVQARNLFAAVVLAGIFSLQMASIFFFLDAADVALTEAAVGAGIATVLFLSALALTGDREQAPAVLRRSPLVVAAAVAALLVYASFGQPLLGDASAPAHTHIAAWYLDRTPELIDVPNVVTAVLASFRGYDTLGELFVILTAGVGVLFVLRGGRPSSVGELERSPDVQGLRHHLVPRVIGVLLLPFIVLFGLYVQFHGDYGPGGGFQAGALMAAGLILYALLQGEAAALRVAPAKLLEAMMAGGALLYSAVGFLGLALGGNFLDYSPLAAEATAGQHWGILLVELGVGLTVTSVLLMIFHAFAGRESP